MKIRLGYPDLQFLLGEKNKRDIEAYVGTGEGYPPLKHILLIPPSRPWWEKIANWLK